MITPEERMRFAAYLEEDARTTDALADQLAKLSGFPEKLEKHYRAYAAAARVVAAKLRATETETLL